MGPIPRRKSDDEGAARNRPLARRFTYRYTVALVVFGAFAIALLWTSSNALSTIDEANRELDTAVKQQARVTSILSVASELVEAEDGLSQSRLADYREMIRALERTHRALVEGSGDLDLPGGPTGELRDVYFENPDLDAAILAFADLAGEVPNVGDEEQSELLARMNEVADPVTGPVSVGLDRVVEGYSQKISDAIDQKQGVNQLMFALLIATLVTVVLALFRPMARSIQLETTNLQEAERVHRENNERQTFHNQLNQALEGAENEDELLEAVARAMRDIIEDQPGELLLVDSSNAHLRQAQVNPGAGGPDCPVDSPHACAAIRRGQTVTYETSRALNVCPKLTQHRGVPCSATCAPVMFLGRAIGVIHTTGDDLRPADPVEIERTNVLARETGNRLGTMRATQKTELQASTDGLTGLPNRRSLEQAAHDLIAVERPFAIAIADLDHFKGLNDTHGHEAGDRALRLFARTLRQNLRPDDVAARYGGEEFVLLLPNTSLEEARRALDRLRVTLAGEIAAAGAVPFTASWGLVSSASGPTFGEMVIAADEALYAAKRGTQPGRRRRGARPKRRRTSSTRRRTSPARGRPRRRRGLALPRLRRRQPGRLPLLPRVRGDPVERLTGPSNDRPWPGRAARTTLRCHEPRALVVIGRGSTRAPGTPPCPRGQ
ncbi:MAG: GGDEF domain-containing protein [Acidimicrobiia bacterium]|nr:GGDEF domain-containing protein [Acidimicrobiia bacterium]